MVRMLPVPVTALPRVQDRMSFLYLEHCVVHREDGALTARNDQGTIRAGRRPPWPGNVGQSPGDEPAR